VQAGAFVWIGLGVFLLIGSIGWILLWRRVRAQDATANALQRELIERLEQLDRAQERDAKLYREEFSRNREEAGVAARAQREELASSMKNVSDSTFKSLGEISAILRGQLEQVVSQSGKLADTVDLRLKELQQDNAQQIEKMRATVDEKLQGT